MAEFMSLVDFAKQETTLQICVQVCKLNAWTVEDLHLNYWIEETSASFE